MNGLKDKLAPRKKISRVPSELIDDLSIYVFILRKSGLTFQGIGKIIGKNHSTVMYHIERYESLSKFNRVFRERVTRFEEARFIKEYKQTGNMDNFFQGILQLPEINREKKELLDKISEFNTIQLKSLIRYCDIIS